MGEFRGGFLTRAPGFRHVRTATRVTAGETTRWLWKWATSVGTITNHSPTGRRFGTLAPGALICFPSGGIMHPEAIHIGADTLIAPDVVLSAGWHPHQEDLPDRVVDIGARCLIGRGSSIVGHESIEIGDDVWTGQHVHVTDMNHGYEDAVAPISGQHQDVDPVVVGDGSWLGHGTIVLPGSRIGRHVVIGAGSVVRGELPDHCVAVGTPARVVSRHAPDDG